MAGEIQLNSTTFATESSGTITVANVNSATNRTNLGLGSIATQNANAVALTGGSLTGTEIDLKSSGTTIYASDGTTAVVSESGGVVTLDNYKQAKTNLDYLSVIFPDGQTPVTSAVTLVSTTSNTLTASTNSTAREIQISGITSGVWFISAYLTHVRVSSVSSAEYSVTLGLEEDSTTIILTGDGEVGSASHDKYMNTSFSTIRDYTSAVPTTIKIIWDSTSVSNYLSDAGSGITVYRLAG